LANADGKDKADKYLAAMDVEDTKTVGRTIFPDFIGAAASKKYNDLKKQRDGFTHITWSKIARDEYLNGVIQMEEKAKGRAAMASQHEIPGVCK